MTNGVVNTLRDAMMLLGLLAVVGGASFAAGKLGPRAAQAGALAAEPSAPDAGAAFRLLQRESLGFLVTERVVTQVVTDAHNGNLFLGYGDGWLVGKVELLYGVDMETLTPDAVSTRDGAVVVRVPTPRLLSYDPDLTSLKFIEKKSALLVMADRLRNESLYQRCLEQLEAAAGRFAAANDLAPSREQLVARLNEYGPLLAARLGADVRFE